VCVRVSVYVCVTVCVYVCVYVCGLCAIPPSRLTCGIQDALGTRPRLFEKDRCLKGEHQSATFFRAVLLRVHMLLTVLQRDRNLGVY
jgi:hypothetical protein